VPPTRADDADWADLLAAIEAVDRHGEVYGPEDIDDEWASVFAHPETDSVFVWDGPELVGFGWQKTQVGEQKDHRIGLWGGVRPSHRGRGIGRRLLDWQLHRASEVAAGLDPNRATGVNVDALDHQADLLALAARAGFEPVRTFLDVARPTSEPVPPGEPIDGLELRPWSDDLDEPTRLAHGEAFLDHWGSEPRGVEAWKQWYTGHRGFRPDLSLVAVDPAGGEVVAFVLSAAYPADWEQGDNPVEAWINSVGTRRAWRGRGVAAWLLAEVLERIAASDTGFERAILGVDADNPTGALRVYRRLGFEDVRVAITLSRGPLP
jgi:mycothiol synthase